MNLWGDRERRPRRGFACKISKLNTKNPPRYGVGILRGGGSKSLGLWGGNRGATPRTYPQISDLFFDGSPLKSEGRAPGRKRRPSA